MIRVRTVLDVADNSGAKKVMCIRVSGSTNKKYASVGEIIKVSIKEATSISKVKKGEVHNALIIRTKCGVRRSDGCVLRFSTNSVVLLNDQKQFLSTRVFGSVSREIREFYPKIASLACVVL